MLNRFLCATACGMLLFAAGCAAVVPHETDSTACEVAFDSIPATWGRGGDVIVPPAISITLSECADVAEWGAN